MAFPAPPSRLPPSWPACPPTYCRCSALAGVARQLCALEPRLWERLEATGGSDVAALTLILNQATAGAYLGAGMALYTEVCSSPAAASNDLLLHLGSSSALAFRTGLAAAQRLAAALQRTAGGLGGDAGAMLRVRLPFLLGLLVRSWALAEAQAAGAAQARCLRKLRRGAWSPQALLQGMVLGSRAAAAVLKGTPG